MSQQFDPADKEEFYDLPNQISDSNENKLKMKLADDVSKFNSFQSKRWQELQEKLDSVAVSLVIQYSINSKQKMVFNISIK